MHNNLLAASLALLSALSIAWGTVIRHRLADGLSDDTGTLSGVAETIRQPRWWLGSFLAMAGYAFQVAALAFGTLLLVQPLLVMKLMLTLPLAARVNGHRISKAETAWSVALTVAVATLVIFGEPAAGITEIPTHVWGYVLALGGIVLGAIYAVAVSWKKAPKALLLGTATGWLYGFVALLSKAVVDIYVHAGAAALALSWELWLLVALSVIGVGIQQAAFNAGSLRESLPAMTVVEPIVAFSLGYLVLGEHFQAQGAEWIALGAALVTMIAATIALAVRSSAGGATGASVGAGK
nr:DMT family transporter [Corynebacterium lactis]